MRSETLLAVIRRLAVGLLIALLGLGGATGAEAQSKEFPFKVANARSELIAHLDLAAPGADWGLEGAEASTARVSVEGLPAHHVIVYGGPRRQTYSVFLGRLPAGSHTLRIERDARQSAQGARLEIYDARIREIAPADPDWALAAPAPIVQPRANTAGRFTDIPLLMYVTSSTEAGQRVLE